MSVEIAWKQNILVTDFHLLKSLLVVLGFGSQAFICGFSRQNINSEHYAGYLDSIAQNKHHKLKQKVFFCDKWVRLKPPKALMLKHLCWCKRKMEINPAALIYY